MKIPIIAISKAEETINIGIFFININTSRMVANGIIITSRIFFYTR